MWPWQRSQKRAQILKPEPIVDREAALQAEGNRDSSLNSYSRPPNKPHVLLLGENIRRSPLRCKAHVQLPEEWSGLCHPSVSITGAKRVGIPADGTENDDKNPPRIAPRNLFDVAVEHDNLFHGDRFRWSAHDRDKHHQ